MVVLLLIHIKLMEQYMFDSVLYLKERLIDKHKINVCHASYSWDASFKWFDIVENETISLVQEKLCSELPYDYINFVKKYLMVLFFSMIVYMDNGDMKYMA